MRVEVMEHFGLSKPFEKVGYFEAEYYRQLVIDIRNAILQGRLIVLSGVIGSGKTVLLRQLEIEMKREGKITVSRSMTVEKSRIALGTLIAALYYDLATGKNVRVPNHVEQRERELCELVKKNKRPVALFVDEAHDLHGQTLIGLKRLMELVEHVGVPISVVLAGHPKLRNDLRRPTMEEIGYRAEIFTLEGNTGSRRAYLDWLLRTCADGKVEPDAILHPDAMNLLAEKLRTPLQIQQHLSRAFEAAYQAGENPVTVEIVDAVLSKQLDDIEPMLVRHGYRLHDLIDLFDAKAAEVRMFLRNQLEATRAQEFKERLLSVGLPV